MRIKIIPGVTVGVGKRGPSVTVGHKAAKVTVSSRACVKAGVPGTSLGDPTRVGLPKAPTSTRATEPTLPAAERPSAPGSRAELPPQPVALVSDPVRDSPLYEAPMWLSLPQAVIDGANDGAFPTCVVAGRLARLAPCLGARLHFVPMGKLSPAAPAGGLGFAKDWIVDEQIAGFVDCSYDGSGDDGFLFTNKGVHYKVPTGADTYRYVNRRYFEIALISPREYFGHNLKYSVAFTIAALLGKRDIAINGSDWVFTMPLGRRERKALMQC